MPGVVEPRQSGDVVNIAACCAGVGRGAPSLLTGKQSAPSAVAQASNSMPVNRDGLRALLARDRAVATWLQEQVGPAYDALKADPSRAVTPAQLRARLAEEQAKG